MFFDGDLQAGIGQALQTSKALICFVRDDSEQSHTWERSFLGHQDIANHLSNNAVTLRIQSGSQEAGFLAAYCPVSDPPTVIAIHHGQLVANLRAGIDFEEFKSTLLAALLGPQEIEQASDQSNSATGDDGVHAAPDPTSSQHAPASANVDSGQSSAPETTHASVTTQPSPTSSPSSNPTPSRQPSTMQQIMEERRRRLDIDKAANDAAEKERRKAAARAQREAEQAAPDSATTKQSQYAREQRKRKQEEKAERERILREIENNKAERKEKEAQRRALAKAEAEKAADAAVPADEELRKTWSSAQECSLQIRLFNGATIRKKFPAENSLGYDVRSWIAQQRTDGDTPFTFKQIVSPLPNKTITISEEEESLRSLGLLPNATLVMVPIQGYTGAYTNTEQGVLGRAASAGYSAASAGGGMIRDALGTFLGFGRATAPSTSTETQDSRADNGVTEQAGGRGDGVKFRTLRRPGEGEREHQLYNGNQLNFEPRRDDHED